MSEYIENVVLETSKLDWAFPFQRTGAWPIDRTELFSSYDDAVLYAKGDGSDARALGGASYVGQTISVFDADQNSVNRYIINIDRTLKAVGSASIGDNLSIEVVDGVIQLRNYGKSYYKYIPAERDEAGEIITPSDYELTEGFIAGLEPRVVLNSDKQFEIAWYEPSTETIEEVSSKLDTIKDDVNNIEDILNGTEDEPGLVDKVDDLKDEIGKAADELGEGASGLYKYIDDKVGAEQERAEGAESALSDRLDILEGDSSIEGSVSNKIEIALANVDHLKREAFDTIDEAEDQMAKYVALNKADQYIYMVKKADTEAGNLYDEYLALETAEAGLWSLERVGDWSIDLTNYATKDELSQVQTALDEEIARATAAEEANADAIAENKTAIDSINEALKEKVDKVYFPVEDDNGDIVQVEGSLLSPTDKEKLDSLVIGEGGDIEISGSVDISNVQGIENWLTQNGPTYIKNLTENNLSKEVVDKLNFITSVNGEVFTVNNGNLDILAISQDKVTGLEDALKGKVDAEEGSRLITSEEADALKQVIDGNFSNYITSVDGTIFTVNDGELTMTQVPARLLTDTVGDLTQLVTFDAENPTTVVDELNILHDILTWRDMTV